MTVQLEPATYEDDKERSRVNAVGVEFDNPTDKNDYDTSIKILFFPIPGLGPKPIIKEIQCDKSNRVQIIEGGHGGTGVLLLVPELIPQEKHSCTVPFMREVDSIITVTEWKKTFGTLEARSKHLGRFDADIFRVRVGAKQAQPPRSWAEYMRPISFEYQ